MQTSAITGFICPQFGQILGTAVAAGLKHIISSLLVCSDAPLVFSYAGHRYVALCVTG